MNSQINVKKYLKNAAGHFKTITNHRRLVREGLFRLGLYRQGLMHDLSKYSPDEFLRGVMNYQGFRSPNAKEREDKGCSEAWMHHKGRNKHHYEYWTDISPDKSKDLTGVRMPVRYLTEMVVDMIAASKIYRGEKYTDASAYEYYLNIKDAMTIHPDTKKILERLLTMLKDKGEDEAYRYMKYLLWKKKGY